MVKVFTGRGESFCISATTVDESTPPERKAPSGTSAIICLAMADSSFCPSPSIASSAVSESGSATPASATPEPDQYSSTRGSAAPASSVRKLPGASLAMPR